jgi:hypothetical protein
MLGLDAAQLGQLHADPGEDYGDDRDNVICAHDGSFGCECSERAVPRPQ